MVNAIFELLLVYQRDIVQGPDKTQRHMLGGKNYQAGCKEPLLSGEEVQHLHHSVYSLPSNIHANK